MMMSFIYCKNWKGNGVDHERGEERQTAESKTLGIFRGRWKKRMADRGN